MSSLVTAGLSTLAMRVPAHPIAQALLRGFGGPVAAPCANPSGRVSPTRAAHVLAGLGGRIAAVVDGGPCGVGVESTILGLTGRAGAAAPRRHTGRGARGCIGAPLTQLGDPARPNAPGQLASHYAPGATLRRDAHAAEAGEVWIGFGPGGNAGELTLSSSGDLVEAAAEPVPRPARSRSSGGAGGPDRGRAGTRPSPRARDQRPAAPRRRPAPLIDGLQALPAEAESISGSMPMDLSARPHFARLSREKTISGDASAVSQPFCRISVSSCPGPQPE